MSIAIALGILAGLGWGISAGLGAALWFSHRAYRDVRGRG